MLSRKLSDVMKRNKRTFYDIYADILTYVSIRPGCRLSYIARYANLPLDRAKTILHYLAKANLISMKDSEGTTLFYVTQKGFEYLELYKRIRILLYPIMFSK
ncbi:MAG: hypothetical protein DRJ47_08720 [Thermoprotei archaeon]|nr:MAG: hypothetical protein DRJ47_08720 [Thermoprotei archaeon]